MKVVHEVKDLQMNIQSTVIEAADKIQKQSIKFVLVCDNEGKLVGTITDGDLRRAVLSQTRPESTLSAIMNHFPKIINEHQCKETLHATMNRLVIKHLPQVDADNRVVCLYVLEDFKQKKCIDNPVIIMAGGLGKRLRPFTKETPKPLISVGGKPVLQWIIESLRAEGFWKFYISINYLAHKVEDYFQDGSEWDVEITYLKESTPLGTAGCLSLLNDVKKPMIVMNGDLITRQKFRNFVEKFDVKKDIAQIGLKEFFYTVPYGCAQIKNNKIISLLEKPVKRFLINAGCYIFSPEILHFIDKDTALDMPCLINQVIAQGKSVSAFHLHEEWIDIGQMEDLMRANELLNRKEAFID